MHWICLFKTAIRSFSMQARLCHEWTFSCQMRLDDHLVNPMIDFNPSQKRHVLDYTTSELAIDNDQTVEDRANISTKRFSCEIGFRLANFSSSPGPKTWGAYKNCLARAFSFVSFLRCWFSLLDIFLCTQCTVCCGCAPLFNSQIYWILSCNLIIKQKEVRQRLATSLCDHFIGCSCSLTFRVRHLCLCVPE